MNYPAFLAAIRDEPDNDVPRLICADWLEDNGESDRAELIRVQIELTRGVQARSRSLELLRRLRALIKQHRAAWLGALAADEPEAVFERGFVVQAALRARTLLEHGEDIFARHPIHRLRVQEIGERGVKVADCEQLVYVTTLDLSDNPLREDALAALGASPHLHRCQSLDLSITSMSSAGVGRLVSGGGLRAVRRLSLRDNNLHADGAEALAEAPHLPALSELNLNSTRIGPGGANALAVSTMLPALEVLRVSYNSLTEAAVRALLTSPARKKLRLLEAYGTEMATEARARLREEFRNRVVC